MNNPITAIYFLWKGISLLKHENLRKFVIIPLFINAVLYSVAFSVSYLYLNQFVMQMIPDYLSWLNWLIYPIFFLIFAIIVFFSFSLIANLIAAPFYAQLAQKTLETIEAQTIIENSPTFWHSIQAEIKKIGYLLKWLIPLGILFFIPIVNIIAPVLWAIFGAWCIAIEYFAYPLENKGLLFEQQKKVVSDIRWGALSFGGFVMIGLSIPLINIFIAPAAVIGATMYCAKSNN